MTLVAGSPALRTAWEVAWRRPVPLDHLGVATCLAAQVILMVVGYHLPATGSATSVYVVSAPELLLHNLGAWAIWALGGLTLGLSTVVQAGLSAVLAGSSIELAVSGHGWSVLGYLGHGLFELPAMAIALWLAVRVPVVMLIARRHRPGRAAELSTLGSVGPAVLLSLALLAAAAIVEVVIVPPT